MKKLIAFTLLFAIQSFFGECYTVVPVPTEIISKYGCSLPLSLNDHNEVLIRLISDDLDGYAIWSGGRKVQIISTDDSYAQFIKLGNNGMVVGRASFKNSKGVWQNAPAIWTSSSSVQEINISKDIPEFSETNFSSIDINSFGQIIGNYLPKNKTWRAFIWTQGKAKDLAIDKAAAALGYQIINIHVQSINDLGTIKGYFEYGSKHPYKDKWLNEGRKYFLWDGELILIDMPEGYSEAVDLNNLDQVLIKNSNEKNNGYVWSEDKGLILIAQDFIPEKFNDRGQILGYECNRGISGVMQNGQFTPLIQEGKDTGAPQNINIIDINNNGIVIGTGYLWGEQHALMFIPDNQ